MFDSSGEPATHPGDTVADVRIFLVNLRWGVHLLVMTLPLMMKDLPWVIHQVCINSLVFFGNVRDN